MGVWDVVEQDRRARWTLYPWAGVGPLRFGMNPKEAWKSVQPDFDGYDGSPSPFGDYATWASYVPMDSRVFGTAVHAYFNRELELSAVAIDARRGPQVVLDGLEVTGRVPSQLEAELYEYTQQRDLVLRYSLEADPVIERLGLVLRAQRAGDLVLTRPLLVSEAWSDRCWDSSESWVPDVEWRKFS